MRFKPVMSSWWKNSYHRIAFVSPKGESSKIFRLSVCCLEVLGMIATLSAFMVLGPVGLWCISGALNLRIPIPFIGGSFRNPKPPNAPNQQGNHIADLWCSEKIETFSPTWQFWKRALFGMVSENMTLSLKGCKRDLQWFNGIKFGHRFRITWKW